MRYQQSALIQKVTVIKFPLGWIPTGEQHLRGLVPLLKIRL